MASPARSAVLTLRVSPDLDRRIERAARQARRTKSSVLREALEAAFARGPRVDPLAEARRQSLLVSGHASEKEVLAFIEAAADLRGWR